MPQLLRLEFHRSCLWNFSSLEISQRHLHDLDLGTLADVASGVCSQVESSAHQFETFKCFARVQVYGRAATDDAEAAAEATGAQSPVPSGPSAQVNSLSAFSSMSQVRQPDTPTAPHSTQPAPSRASPISITRSAAHLPNLLDTERQPSLQGWLGSGTAQHPERQPSLTGWGTGSGYGTPLVPSVPLPRAAAHKAALEPDLQAAIGLGRAADAPPAAGPAAAAAASVQIRGWKARGGLSQGRVSNLGQQPVSLITRSFSSPSLVNPKRGRGSPPSSPEFAEAPEAPKSPRLSYGNGDSPFSGGLGGWDRVSEGGSEEGFCLQPEISEDLGEGFAEFYSVMDSIWGDAARA